MSEFEEFAQIAMQNMHNWIDLENEIIKDEHHLIDMLDSTSYICFHLEEMDLENTHLVKINIRVGEIIGDILKLYQEKPMTFVKEEKDFIVEFEEAFEHRDWRLIHKLEEKEEEMDRVLKELLKNLKELFHEACDELAELKDEHFKGVEEAKPYFEQLQKWAKIYYKILHKLYEKEETLLKHEKHAIKVLERTRQNSN